MMKNYYVFLPDSKTALKLYGLIKKEGIKCTMAPTPWEADACCGVSILYYDFSDTDKIKEIIEEEGIKISKFWESEKIFNPERNKFC